MWAERVSGTIRESKVKIPRKVLEILEYRSEIREQEWIVKQKN